jgi:hypothetical protein
MAGKSGHLVQLFHFRILEFELTFPLESTSLWLSASVRRVGSHDQSRPQKRVDNITRRFTVRQLWLVHVSSPVTGKKLKNSSQLWLAIACYSLFIPVTGGRGIDVEELDSFLVSTTGEGPQVGPLCGLPRFNDFALWFLANPLNTRQRSHSKHEHGGVFTQQGYSMCHAPGKMNITQNSKCIATPKK